MTNRDADLQSLCQFYEKCWETKTRQTVVNESLCPRAATGWSCGCYSCSQFIQHHAKWQHGAIKWKSAIKNGNNIDASKNDQK